MPELLASFAHALHLPLDDLPRVAFPGVGALPSTFAVSDFATASIGVAGLAVADLLRQQGHCVDSLSVDRRLASFWFANSLRPMGWAPPPAWDPIAGDYASADGWIRLHTNAPHHRAAALRVLGDCADRDSVAAAVSQWSGEALESAVIEANGCAAQMRDLAQWAAHPQGQAVAEEALIHRVPGPQQRPLAWHGNRGQPLAGIKVLDLTRIIAGPVATRFLASMGADVLRIDPPGWEEPSVVAELTLGKRCARLDLHDSLDRLTFERLLAQADVFVHGYRADALERLGYDHQRLQQLAPGLVDISLNAYGWTGPWRNRRGFDSLVQMSSGIAAAGQQWRQADTPVPLPVQALDMATGYLLAAAAITGLRERLATGQASSARLSLARTAKALVDHGQVTTDLPLAAETGGDLASQIEHTPWGPAQRLTPPLQMPGTPMQWACPAGELGASPASFPN
ncbi:CoA transferase [Pseudomonas sp.]|uniref:CoA transferase n=1 Tax=Pseudomonas sp. TaxID=306 RepID=UPI003CC64418